MEEPFELYNLVMKQEFVEWDMKRIRPNRSGVTSDIQAEHLQHWITESWEKDTTNYTKWSRVAELVQTLFWDGLISKEATRKSVVLIPKGGGDFWGVGLVEVLWKT